MEKGVKTNTFMLSITEFKIEPATQTKQGKIRYCYQLVTKDEKVGTPVRVGYTVDPNGNLVNDNTAEVLLIDMLIRLSKNNFENY